MLTTDAWAFLDIRNPLCAWNVYRGCLISPPTDPGFISVWTAALLRRATGGDYAPLAREVALERVRAALFPNRISRFKGLYCFMDQGSAEQALSWGSSQNHFHPQYVAELSLEEAGPKRDRLDSNWLTYSPRDQAGFFSDISWIPRYWQGDAMPDRCPVWETGVDGRIAVLGTHLRERAYGLLKVKFPDSLLLLETGRIAAWIGSDLGNSTVWLHSTDNANELELAYLIDMRDATNATVLDKMKRLMEKGHPVNWDDMRPQIAKGNLGAAPDFRPMFFRFPKSLLY